MNLEEIYVGYPRDVALPPRTIDFDGAENVATAHEYILKKNISDNEIYYGLFDDEDLIAYLKLEKYNDKLYQVRLSQVGNGYKGHGYGSMLYDYAVMNDKLHILSDTHQSPEAQKVWQNIQAFAKYAIVPYNIKTDQEESDRVADVYTEEGRDELVWLAIPGNETINEALMRRNRGREEMGQWNMTWYGPQINGEY